MALNFEQISYEILHYWHISTRNSNLFCRWTLFSSTKVHTRLQYSLLKITRHTTLHVIKSHTKWCILFLNMLIQLCLWFKMTSEDLVSFKLSLPKPQNIFEKFCCFNFAYGLYHKRYCTVLVLLFMKLQHITRI